MCLSPEFHSSKGQSECNDADCIMLRGVLMKIITLSSILKSVTMLNVILLKVFLQKVFPFVCIMLRAFSRDSMTLSITTFSIMKLSLSDSINDTQHNNVLLSVIMLSVAFYLSSC
jgi:hypothetical protein